MLAKPSFVFVLVLVELVSGQDKAEPAMQTETGANDRSNHHHLHQNPNHKHLYHSQNSEYSGGQADPNLMYPYDETHFLSSVNSMKQFHDQPLPFRLPFSGFAFNYVWIHKDGYVSFNKGLKSYSFPLEFPMTPESEHEEDPSMIAIFFAHQDIPSSVDGAGVYLQLVNMANEKDIELKKRIYHDFQASMACAVGFEPQFALIITWKNMTFPNRREPDRFPTNTYQMVLATDELMTLAMFNYEQIEWITHLDNFDGLKGPAAFIGFNGGNSTQAYEYVPFSQNPRISTLPKHGWGNGLPGRYFFTIEEELEPGACVDKELDPNLPDRMDLHTSSDYVLMLGGEELNWTGPCLTEESTISCNFDVFRVPGQMKSNNIGACIVPAIMYEGYVDFTVSVDDKTYWYSRMYVQSPESRREFPVLVKETNIVESLPIEERKDEKHHLTIEWFPESITWRLDAKVSISLYGYQEKGDVYPQLTYLVTLADGVDNNGEIQLDLHDLPKISEHLSNYEYQFGFIGINMTGERWTQTIWSNAMPIGWYLSPYWKLEFGNDWQYKFCRKWFDREMNLDYFATTVPRCPCKIVQSDYDRGRFAPDLQCNVIDKKCNTLHHGVQHCVRSARPSVGGSGQTCCYDDYGELVQSADTMYGGRPSRAFVYGKHPFKMQTMVPTLSYWYYDVMPFFYCCKWSHNLDDSDTCQMYNYWRTSQDCSSYQPPHVASIFGDPHVVTFDNVNYTFNGKGEFVLVHSDSEIHKLDIHGRFESIGRTEGTHLTAVAVRDNQSSIVELRLRPPAARWQYQLYMFADKEMYYFWQPDMRSISLRGVHLYQPAGIRNMSRIIAMFDSGAGVEVSVTPAGSLMLNVYLPQTFLNATSGLMGRWTGSPDDDFTKPDGSVDLVPSERVSMQDIYTKFASHYRLQETKTKHLPQSLFWHDPVSHAHYDDRNFQPRWHILQEDIDQLKDVYRICSDSMACLYDYVVTKDSNYAQQTKKDEAMASTIWSTLNETVIRCPALARPINGRKSENRYWPGTIVRFVCNEGYRLVGYEVRRCREDGLWSWGVDPECVPELSYRLQLSLIYSSLIVPILVVVIGLVYWASRYYNNNTVHSPESMSHEDSASLHQDQDNTTLEDEREVL